MKKNYFILFLPILVLLAFLECCQENSPISEEKVETSTEFPTDLSGKLILNRPYTDGSYGYVLIDPSSSISSQLTQSKTIYEIQDKIDLRGGKLTIPSECVLRFNGGSIVNADVIFDYTYLEGLVTFSGCSFSGTLYNKEVVLSWFGASTSVNDNSSIINSVLKIIPETLVLDGLYKIGSSIVIPRSVTIRGLDWNEGVYANRVQGAEYGFKTASNITAIKFDRGGGLNLYGVAVLGNENLYISRNTHEGVSTCGILISSGYGSLGSITDCCFVGFTYGIRAVGGYIEKIRGTYFSACRFGLDVRYTSDFICEDCHFNTNLLNYMWEQNGIDDTKASKLADVGAGVRISCTGMTQFLGCRFEFNFIHFIIDEAAIIANIENNIFDNATHSCILLYNGTAGDNHLVASEMQKSSIDCVNISGNTFCRGARLEIDQSTSTTSSGSGILYVCEQNDRGTNINFCNNVVVDSIEVDYHDVNYEKTIFRIFNTSDGTGVINSSGNDFSHCKAQTVASAVNGSKGRFTIKDNGSNFGNISHQFQNNSVIDIQKMEVGPDGKITVWNTLTNGNSKSVDTVIDPNK